MMIRIQVLLLVLSFLMGVEPALAGNDSATATRTVTSSSQEAAAQQLQNYIDTAIANNAGLKATFESYQARKQTVRPAGTLPDSKLTYVHFIRSVETRVGPQEHKLGIAQSFPWFGTLSLQSKIAEDNAQALFLQFEGQRLSLIRNVKHTYFDAYYLGRSIDILDQNLDLIANLERVTRSRYRAGIGDFSDVIRSQVELEKLKDQLKTMTDLKTPLIARFNTLLSQPPDTEMEWPKFLASPKSLVDPGVLRAALAEANPQLKGLDTIAERERKKIKLAKKDGLPNFTLGLDYILTGDAAAAVPDSGKDAIAAMVTLDIPLWRGKYRDQVNEAKSNEGAARKMKEETLNQLIAELSQAIYEHSDATRKIELYQTNLVPKGRQSFEATKRSYEAGKASFSDLIDAERLLLEFQLGFEDALTHANKADASIAALLGRASDESRQKQEKE
jgi:outer membrane protein TolC